MRNHIIVVGLGHLGRRIANILLKLKVSFVVVTLEKDSVKDIVQDLEKIGVPIIFGDARSREILTIAGVQHAKALITAFNDDLLCPVIAQRAKSLNKKIFTVARENSLEELNIFQAAKINKIYVLEQILADSTYNHLAKPLSEAFIKEVRKKDETWAKVIVEMLNNMTGLNPNYFETVINEEHMYALSLELKKGTHISLAKLRRSREDREKMLHIVYLILKRDGKIYLMPDNHMQLKIGDEILIVADDESREDFEYITNNIHELNYILGMDTTKVFLETK